MEEWWEKYKVSLPTGESGDWKVVKDKPPAGQFGGVSFHEMVMGRDMPTDQEYTRLLQKGYGVWMSDTPAEIRDHAAVLWQIEGTRNRPGAETVLIHGMGIGMTLQCAIKAESVKSIDVVEIEPDVLKLTTEHYMRMAVEHDTNLTIWEDDALTKKWPTGQRWDVVWHDIWGAISEENLEAMHTLHRRFGRRCGWQGSWARELIEDRY